MSKLLNSAAVSSLSGKDVEDILHAYIETGPTMAQNHTPAAMQKQPQGTGAGDHLITPR